MDDPIGDSVRSILNGHIVLTRMLAMQNHYPAIDVLASGSRLDRDLWTADQLELVSRARETLAVYRKKQDFITVGAYPPGTNPAIDQAIYWQKTLETFLRLPVDQGVGTAECWKLLSQTMQPPPPTKPVANPK